MNVYGGREICSRYHGISDGRRCPKSRNLDDRSAPTSSDEARPGPLWRWRRAMAGNGGGVRPQPGQDAQPVAPPPVRVLAGDGVDHRFGVARCVPMVWSAAEGDVDPRAPG